MPNAKLFGVITDRGPEVLATKYTSSHLQCSARKSWANRWCDGRNFVQRSAISNFYTTHLLSTFINPNSSIHPCAFVSITFNSQSRHHPQPNKLHSQYLQRLSKDTIRALPPFRSQRIRKFLRGLLNLSAMLLKKPSSRAKEVLLRTA